MKYAKQIDVSPGERIESACRRLADAAPAFMVFNGVRIHAARGETASQIHQRWQSKMHALAEADRKKREAYLATPEGKAELAAAEARQQEQERRREESLRTIEASGVRKTFQWTDDMREISGFGGRYEAACRDMLYAGIAWLQEHPNADLKAKTYTNVIGLLIAESTDAKSLEKAVVAACPDCSGAMHHVTMLGCIFISRNGWDRYAAAMRKQPRSKAAGGPASC